MCAFALLEVNGDDIRAEPIEIASADWPDCCACYIVALRSMRPIEVTARIIFKRACALGCEGLVSNHLGSPYRAGRSDYWIKIESPAAPA